MTRPLDYFSDDNDELPRKLPGCLRSFLTFVIIVIALMAVVYLVMIAFTVDDTLKG